MNAAAFSLKLSAMLAGVAVVWSGVGSSSAYGAIDPLSGIDFVTIGATYGGAGNAAYQSGIPNQRVNGRGSVGYEYNIGRMEVTTAQWVEFFNAAYDRPANDRIPWVAVPNFWGAAGATPNTPGGLRWSVPAGNENIPVGDISWRMAAIYCNWLHNGKSTDRAVFMSGAYDVSTFTFTANRFNDQSEHSPGARYWIPTWDEWLKAAHYDPDKDNGDGTTGGWWQYSNTSDTAPIYGPPGIGEANAGFDSPRPFNIPLGAYPDVQSPWGLLDVAGGTAEWTESINDLSSAGKFRVYDGSRWNQDFTQTGLLDQIRYYGDDFPQIALYPTGLRIASAIPSPGPCALSAGLCIVCVQRRRRSSCGGRATTPRSPRGIAIFLAASVLVANSAHGAIDPLSGIDFVRIGATYGGAGNAAYQSGIPNQRVNGRGSVGYEYNIGRMEVTTAQWVEFFNAAYDRPAGDSIPWLLVPNFWGATSTTPNTPGGQRWMVPAGNENIPVGDISWRMAAIYCNWLHNGKSTDRAAFMSGAYDVSTFTFTGNRFNDQSAHSPGARYWIPTWDEWLKAAHYDPDKDNGDGTTGGWWQYANTSDTALVYGPPGVGQANAGFDSPNPFTIPLGAYPDVQSPWGLLDLAGGTAEWTESVLDLSSGGKYRYYEGSWWDQDLTQAGLVDHIRGSSGDFPQIAVYPNGLRIASAVPSPGPCALGAGLCIVCVQRRRRSSCGGSRRSVL